MNTLLSPVFTAYANWKIKPRKQELVSYNKTNKILLTFDDYTDEVTLKKILTVLRAYNVTAIFFVIGQWALKNQHLIKLIEKEGHLVGNHTKTHVNLLTLDDAAVRQEILEGPSSTLLRPPYGKYNKRIRKIAEDLGYKICYWNIDSDDWQGISKNEIIHRVLRYIHEGACILLHLNAPHTVNALPTLIQKIKKLGYTFCESREDIDL